MAKSESEQEDDEEDRQRLADRVLGQLEDAVYWGIALVLIIGSVVIYIVATSVLAYALRSRNSAQFMVGSRALPAVQQTGDFQRVNAVADRAPAHLEHLRQLPLRRQLVARLQFFNDQLLDPHVAGLVMGRTRHAPKGIAALHLVRPRAEVAQVWPGAGVVR